MLTYTAAPWRAAALLAASLAAMPAIAQSTADDPAAAVPETRYQGAHVQRAPATPATTPDRNWRESNRTVASQPAHGDHGAHAGHAAPTAKAAPQAGPHDQRHGKHQSQPHGDNHGNHHGNHHGDHRGRQDHGEHH